MVDESTGMAVVNYLRSLGYDVLAVAETISQAADSDVLARASSEGRILVTNDKDFGELAFRVGQVHQGVQGVLLLRLQDESPTNCVRVLKAVLEQYAARLPSHFTVATESGVRIRPARSIS